MKVWTSTLGIGRTLLGISTFLTLLFNDTSILFTPGVGALKCPSCIGISKISLYCIFIDNLELGRWLSLAILLLVIIGWRPAVTGILHWWVCFSLNSTALIIDGGDQVAAVLSLLLVPICLTDTRNWHWINDDNEIKGHLLSEIKGFIGYSSYVVIRIQVALIYFEATISKFKVNEWLDGTALYYWFLNPYMGVNDSLRDIFHFLLTNSFIVTFTTWGALFLEFSLFSSLFIEKRYRIRLYLIGLVFHGLIAFFFGLIPFFFSMASALTLYLYPIDKDLLKTIISNLREKVIDPANQVRVNHSDLRSS